MLIEELGETIRRFTDALRRLLPGLSEREVLWRFHFVAGALGHTVSCAQVLERYTEGACGATNSEDTLRFLVTFLASGLRAPASAGPDLQGEPA